MGLAHNPSFLGKRVDESLIRAGEFTCFTLLDAKVFVLQNLDGLNTFECMNTVDTVFAEVGWRKLHGI